MKKEKEKRISKTITIRPSILAKAEKVSDENNLSLSAFISLVLAEYFKKNN